MKASAHNKENTVAIIPVRLNEHELAALDLLVATKAGRSAVIRKLILGAAAKELCEPE